MMPPIHHILVHDYRQPKPVTDSINPPNVNITTSTTNKNLDGIYILPAPRMNPPAQTQYQMIHAPDSMQHPPTFSKNNTSRNSKSHQYSK
ncbi:BBM_1a_G0024980.mRNA.1.CDS.1 [Saccharomyces cerevisiae]|nr:BBM_1a_G0024980.mRNA.1.CDS.1 [Saccharomyces cerevisiae]CAI7158118.1 BBM_1a_G0024980.mRNA.1.CDS.1 [Saccharomyces cerevisiae]